MGQHLPGQPLSQYVKASLRVKRRSFRNSFVLCELGKLSSDVLEAACL